MSKVKPSGIEVKTFHFSSQKKQAVLLNKQYTQYLFKNGFFWKVNLLFGANRKVGKSLLFPHWHVAVKEELFILQVNKPGDHCWC